uniref:Uncharacterized protein n=1 Tax=Anguilla anguilla TaxID=7936 RepID=A0A0E9S5K6_ANGAN
MGDFGDTFKIHHHHKPWFLSLFNELIARVHQQGTVSETEYTS